MPKRQENKEVIEKEPWWNDLRGFSGGKIGPVTVSRCCNVPITCPRCGYGYTCDWRCSKCNQRTYKDGSPKSTVGKEVLMTETEYKAKLANSQLKTFGKAPVHGLLRKEIKAGDAYQPEMPDFPLE